MKVLFLLQNFVTKTLEDSAGYHEIALPLIHSGLLSDYRLYDWGIEEQAVARYIHQQCQAIASQIGQTPVTIYGAGAHTEAYWADFNVFNVVAIADRQAEKMGHAFLGMEVITPEAISTEVILISSRAWEKSISQALAKQYPQKTIILLYNDLQRYIQDLNHTKIESIQQLEAGTAFDLIVYTPSDPAEALTQLQMQSLRQHFNAKLGVVWWDYDDTCEDNVYSTFERASLAAADLIIDPGNYTKTFKMYNHSFPYEGYQHVDKIKILPTPLDKNTFYPRVKTIDVAMFGSVVGLRKRWIDFLVHTYPGRFHHIGGVGGGKKAIPMTEYAALAGQAKIIVNSQTYSFRSQCKGKVREALASGALLIEEDCFDTRVFFDNQDIVKYYRTEAELKDLVDYYLVHEDERSKIADLSYRWYLDNWSSDKWAEKVLAQVR